MMTEATKLALLGYSLQEFTYQDSSDNIMISISAVKHLVSGGKQASFSVFRRVPTRAIYDSVLDLLCMEKQACYTDLYQQVVASELIESAV